MVTSILLATIFLSSLALWGEAAVIPIDQAISQAAHEVQDTSLLWDDSSILVELDMRFTHQQWQEIQETRGDYDRRRYRWKRKAYNFEHYRWDNGVVPYTISDGFTANGKKVIREAMKEWERVTCVTFREASGREKASINILPTGGCSSAIGKTGRAGQVLTLGGGCQYKGVVIHELGHALGFFHEQSRPDRNSFVTIHKQNIKDKMEYNFKSYPSNVINTYSIPYDYTSIMHYGPYYFSKNGQRTISARREEDTKKMGSRYGLSFNDIHLANKMYKCADACGRKSCRYGAFLGKDCRCWCKGPDSQTPVIDCETRQPIRISSGVKPTTIIPTTIIPTVVDQHEDCPDWARAGYCEYDWYTITYCKKSCRDKSLRPTTSPPQEEDKHSHCPVWAENGECDRNPGYMLVYCKISCKRWRVKPLCKDATPRICSIYRRECFSRTLGSFMRRFCSKTCGSCTPEQLLESCEDEAPRTCSVLAFAGKCKSKDLKAKTTMLQLCPKSCKLCQPPRDPSCGPYGCNKGRSAKVGRVSRGPNSHCRDRFPYCRTWARTKGCSTLIFKNVMKIFCRQSCNFC